MRAAHAFVHEVGVLGQPHPELVQEVIAFVVLVHVSNGSTPERAYALLGERHRVVTLEEPSAADLQALGAEQVSLWGGDAALRLALEVPESIATLVLESPAAPSDLEQLAALNVPTLVVYGTQDTVNKPETGRVYRDKLPNCNYVLVYKAGHDVATDRPEAFASLVGDFLERREAFIVSQRNTLLHP